MKQRIFFQTLFTTLAFVTGSFYLNASEVNGTGLKPPTEEELQHIHSNKISHVAPNKIGAKRIQLHHQKKKGEAAPQMTIAKTHEEEFAMVGAKASATATDLPSYVNNSLLPCFPHIGNQGQIGSCVAWATTYYQATHETGLVNGTNNRTIGAQLLSPKWTYNMLNSGVDAGLYITAPYNLLHQNGAVTFADFPYNSNYREWNLDPSNWIRGMSFRMRPYKALGGLNSSPQDLRAIKQALANGHVLVFGTYIYSWSYSRIQSNPNTLNRFVGQLAGTYVHGTMGSHCMTIVGYDDDIWIDVNGNGQVDPGELGGFLVANSWGTSWGNQGFVWISYDAFLNHSAVPNGPSSGRVAAASVSNSTFLSSVPKAAHYTPSLIAQFDLSQSQRNQIKMQAGSSSVTETAPTKYYASFAVWLDGGPYRFDGISSSTPQRGVFPLDISDLISPQMELQRFYLLVYDVATGRPTTMNSLSLMNLKTGETIPGLTMPTPIDNHSWRQAIDYAFTTAAAKPLTLQVTAVSPSEEFDEVVHISVQPSHAIKKMEVFVDSQHMSTEDHAPYLTFLDHSQLSKGTHEVVFIAYDEWNQAAIATTKIDVKN